jgi:hypothetical protein
MNHTQNHYIPMFFIMLLSGGLSTMNVWANSPTDIYFSLNDIYMILLMTGWMFFFMGIYYKSLSVFFFGSILVALNLWTIRTQFLVTEDQFLRGMIPHHSMAVLMSKKLQEKPNTIQSFLEGIVETQLHEIQFMKQRI